MKIIIVGCGKVGRELVAVLSQEGNDVVLIDRDEATVEELCDNYDVMGLAGNGASHSVQVEAGIEEADLLIAVTGSDEMNLLCCLIARMSGKNCHTIARLRNPEYSGEIGFLKEELGLAMVINQEATAAREIARVMKFPSAIDIVTFAKGKVELPRFRIPQGSVLDGVSLVNMHEQLHCDVLVASVETDGKVIIPNGDYTLHSGDVITIVSDTRTEESFFRKIGIQTNRVKNVIIVGGGDIAYYLAKMLVENSISVKLIERRLERCEYLSERLPKATIVHGDGSDRQLLLEEGLESTEGFVALTDFDEENVILSLFARQSGVRKIVTKINRIAFDEVIDKLELDTTVHPRLLTAEYILQYVRARKNSMGSNVETMHWLVENKVEALEFYIREGFVYDGKTLMELQLKPGVLIACIYRGGQVILPRGRDVMQVGDTVIVVTTIAGMNDINDIFVER